MQQSKLFQAAETGMGLVLAPFFKLRHFVCDRNPATS